MSNVEYYISAANDSISHGRDFNAVFGACGSEKLCTTGL